MKELYNKLYHGKWEDNIINIPDNFVDLIVTSPPYNIKLGQNKHKTDKYDTYDDNMPYNEYLNWMEYLFTECHRVLKYGGKLCVNIADGANGSVPTHSDFTHMILNNIENDPFKMITTIVWDKGQIGNSCSWGSFCSPSCPSFPTQFEFIIVFGKGDKKHQGEGKVSVSKDNFIRNSRALWKINPETEMMSKYGHPACFPIEVPRRLIDQFTYIDDIVLDPFSGVGTTCAAAKGMKRKYIGFEISENYHKVAEDRLSLISEINDNGFPVWM
jgi:modification methylase